MNERTELRIISDIADRAFKQVSGFDDRRANFVNLLLDIENFHRLCPLELSMLLDADIRDFAHDVVGIWNHYDRQNDRITGCFVPRMAQCNHRSIAA